ncbi:ribonuclease G [Ignatzschineria sp. RMDPL8A]|uniref:ribonuclease G n=1 Tax=Ignatzschineria sp. RMDPL8A TaxID=2999236 RepID=UPI0024467643|nr:ribonuclease G [Ignatzschineria sp. RMDPL8A]MDG9729972.1 ribonuclease G [Ignatzschineria sp. RMDPL8A]
MNNEILINITPKETRAAVITDGTLQEILIEREEKRGLVGNIYKGVVVRVLPGMEAAFVDIGLERAAFLHVSDIQKRFDLTDDKETLEHELGGSQEPKKPIDISQLVRQGQELIVQVIKDPLGTKGARITTQISIPSCYLVHLADSDIIGVSIRIDDEEERDRLKTSLQFFQEEIGGAYIARTAAEGVDPWVLRADMQFLSRLWGNITGRMKKAKVGEIIYGNFPLEMRILRDYISKDIKRVRIDSHEAYENMIEFTQSFLPELTERIEVYQGSRPIFDLFNIEEEIERALEKRVPLKSGGYLMIEQTEAMTTIDVNTGAFVGYRNLEETIFKTNLEAAQALARQVRLRNLGGIIIIDFIDMQSEAHKQGVLDELAFYLSQDYARTTISEVTSLGLVQMTRKRTRESLEHVLCEPCPKCQGKGYVKTSETVCLEVFRELLRESRQYPNVKEFLVLASTQVVERLLDEEAHSVAELQNIIDTNIRLQPEELYSVEQFDIVPM